MAILISDKIDIKIKNIIRYKEEQCIMIRGSIQEDITIINIYTPSRGPFQYIRETLTATRGETDSNTIIVEDFNTQIIPMDRSSKQRISNKIETLNETLDQMNLIDNFRTFHPNAENIVSSKVIQQSHY